MGVSPSGNVTPKLVQLPDMPIFLTPDHYVPCPLEAPYQVTWGVFPRALKGPLEVPPK